LLALSIYVLPVLPRVKDHGCDELHVVDAFPILGMASRACISAGVAGRLCFWAAGTDTLHSQSYLTANPLSCLVAYVGHLLIASAADK